MFLFILLSYIIYQKMYILRDCILITYVIKYDTNMINSTFLSRMEYIIHCNNINEDYLIKYLLDELEELYNCV